MDCMEKKRYRLHRRQLRGRKKIHGTAEVPRLVVYRSLRHFYAQLVDDTAGATLVSASSLDKEFAEGKRGNNIEGAKEVGRLFALRAKEKGFSRVVFDRAGRKYHGRIKAFADAVREGGLIF